MAYLYSNMKLFAILQTPVPWKAVVCVTEATSMTEYVNKGSLIYLAHIVGNDPDCFMWQQAVYHLVLLKLASSHSPCHWEQCNAVDIWFLCTIFKECDGHGSLWLADISHVKNTLFVEHWSSTGWTGNLYSECYLSICF